MKVLVPVRYPLTPDSRATAEAALKLVQDEPDDAELVFMHVNLFQDEKKVTWKELRRTVERNFDVGNASYVIRKGFLVEETILEEAADQDADVIVIGRTRAGRLRRALRRLIGNDPNVENFLRQNLDVRIEVVD